VSRNPPGPPSAPFPPKPAADRRSFWIGIALGAVCALIWGIQAVVSRQSVADGLTAADVTVVRVILSGLVLMPLALRMRPFPVGRLGFARALVITCLAGAPYSFMIVGGAAFAPAIHIAVIGSGLIPLFSALLAFALIGERASAAKVAAVGTVLIGIGLFSWEAFIGAPLREGAWRGDLVFVLTALMWSTFGLVAQRWSVHAVEGTVTICVLSLLTVPLWVAFLPMNLAHVSVSAIALQAIYQGLVVGVLSLFLYTRVVALLGPVSAAMFVPLVPIVTAVGGIVFLAEWPSVREWLGMLLVVIGMTLALRSGRAR
jgi:drug/metabolite transporter (DMT)-like permease